MGTPESIARQLDGIMKDKKAAMERAVKTVEAQAKREAPVKRGGLRRSITSRVEQGGDVGIVGTNLVYARRIHEGFPKHILRPKNKKALFWKGAAHPVKLVRHPGNKANPYFTRAANTSRAAVERELAAWGNAVFSKVK